jgi:hypothetical protein
MKPSDLDRAVARATGETVSEIRRMGFSLLVPAAPVPAVKFCNTQRPRKSGAGRAAGRGHQAAVARA